MATAAQSLITKDQVATLLSRSVRWVEQHRDHFKLTEAGEHRNGRPTLLYAVDSLPEDAQLRWADLQDSKVIEMVSTREAPGQLALALTIPAGPNLSTDDRIEAERRFVVIQPLIAPETFRGLWLQCRESKGELVELLAKEHGTKPRTIYRWLKAFRDGGLPALVTKDRADKGLPRALNTAALDFLVAAALPKKGEHGVLSVREIYRAYVEERAWRAAHATKPLSESEEGKYARYLDKSGRLSSKGQLPAACYETFRNWFQRIPNIVKVLAREGEEAFHNTQEILSFRALSELRPLDYVVMDHRRLDIFCMVQERRAWKLVRPWLTAAIDMRTRKWLSWVVVETPSSDSIASVLKRSFIDHGVPSAVYWDNGKDFTCEWLEGSQTKARQVTKSKELEPAMHGVLETLGVRVHHAIVRRARSKIIEPNFGNVANFDKMLPWWCGHKPTARPERFAELVDQHEEWARGERADPAFPTIEQVAGVYDEFLESLNEREHSGEGMQKVTPTGRGWMCPNECWERTIRKVERRTVPAEVLQLCFNKRRDLTIRNGEVRTTFGGRQFHYRLADSSVRLMAMNGSEVQFAYDPLDLGTAAIYHRERFIGLVNCVELRRMGEQAFVADERCRRAARREVKRFINAVHEQVYVPAHQERAARRQAVKPARIEPERLSIPVTVPEAVSEAFAAAQTDRGFSFGAAASGAERGADLIRRADAEAYRDDDPDDEFEFFSKSPTGGSDH